MTDKLEAVRRLLGGCRSIVDRYDWLDNRQARKFNIFDVLGRTTDEVKGHSAFIAELLNPKGSHGSGSVFLRSFFGLLSDASAKDIATNALDGEREWSVSTEQSFSIPSAKFGESSGRIDLILETNDACVIIENKIYAEDQERQLERYYDYAKSRRKTVLLIYLTLHGDEPEKNTLGDLDPSRVLCVSYEDTILKWIEHCISLASLVPHLREWLLQYQRIVERIASGIRNKELTVDLSNIILEVGNLPIAMEIEKALPLAKASVHWEFCKELRKEMQSVFPNQDGNYIHSYGFGEAVVKKCHDASKGRPRGFGLSYDLIHLAQGHNLAFSVELYDWLSFSISYCVGHKQERYEGIQTVEDALRTVEQADNSFSRSYWTTGMWQCPKPVICWRPFNETASMMADPNERSRTVNAYVAKVRELLSSLRDSFASSGVEFADM